MPETRSRPIDFYEPIADLEDGDYDVAEVTTDPTGGHDGTAVVPMRCHGCGRPTFYDYNDERYHHAIDADLGCFLIAAEVGADNFGHPYVERCATPGCDRRRLGVDTGNPLDVQCGPCARVPGNLAEFLDGARGDLDRSVPAPHLHTVDCHGPDGCTEDDGSHFVDYTFRVDGVDRDGNDFTTTAKNAAWSMDEAEDRVRRVCARDLFSHIYRVVLVSVEVAR